MPAVNVAIVGVGNCAASLVQGVHFYRDAEAGTKVPGLMHVAFGEYHVRDVNFVAAFDVDGKKVGLDLGRRHRCQPEQHDQVRRCPAHRCQCQQGKDPRRPRPLLPRDDRRVRRRARRCRGHVEAVGADVVVCYLPVGSEEAARFYAECAMAAGCAFVNALPVFIASDPIWASKFTDAGLPIIGDDIKSQVGATITHRVLAKLFEDRGVELQRTMQLNVGGNMDFKNMLERDRLESKKISKTQSVTSQVDRDLGADNVHIGPSDYVAWLDDRKWAYVRLEGKAFGDVPLNLEYKLEVWDSPNSAGHHHRRHPGGQDRPRPRHRWPGAERQQLLHEVAAGAVRRPDRARRGRGVHPRRRLSAVPLSATSALRPPASTCALVSGHMRTRILLPIVAALSACGSDAPGSRLRRPPRRHPLRPAAPTPTCR